MSTKKHPPGDSRVHFDVLKSAVPGVAKSSPLTHENVLCAANDIVMAGRRCYEKAVVRGDYRASNEHRTAAMEQLEGLKTLMIVAHQSDTPTYARLRELWDTVLHWT